MKNKLVALSSFPTFCPQDELAAQPIISKSLFCQNDCVEPGLPGAAGSGRGGPLRLQPGGQAQAPVRQGD